MRSVELRGRRLLLRPLAADDFDWWRDVRRRSADWLLQWEPRPPPGTPDSSTSAAAFAARCSARQREWQLGAGYGFGIFVDGAGFAGEINLSGVQRGPFQNAYVGYWVDRFHAGQGYVPEAFVVLARFDTRFLQLGLHPGGGHTWMLTRIAGPQTAAATVLFGEVLDGAAAERCGLAWRCVDDDALLDHARALAGRAASAPHALARRVKQTLAAVAGVQSSEEAVALELEAQLWSMSQPDFAERLAALRARTQSR